MHTKRKLVTIFANSRPMYCTKANNILICSVSCVLFIQHSDVVLNLPKGAFSIALLSIIEVIMHTMKEIQISTPFKAPTEQKVLIVRIQWIMHSTSYELRDILIETEVSVQLCIVQQCEIAKGSVNMVLVVGPYFHAVWLVPMSWSITILVILHFFSFFASGSGGWFVVDWLWLMMDQDWMQP